MVNILIASFFYAIFQICASYASQKISNVLFVVVGTASMVLWTFFVVIFQLKNPQMIGELNYTGILLTIISNGAITIFTLFLAKSFQQSAPELVIPMVFGTAILISTICSFFLRHTFPSSQQLLSLMLISFGLILLAFFSR